MSRILFMCNAPWVCTGYGVQGKHLVPRLQALGHDVAYFAFWGLDGGIISYDGYRVYPPGLTTWGEDVLEHHMRSWEADTLITLLDVWVSKKYGQLAAKFGWRWLPWLPVDTEPVSPRILESLDGAHIALPYSRFGERQLREAGVERVQYVPHGVSGIYCPGDRAAARERTDLPQDVFIIGMVAANKGFPSRKAIPEQMLAFAKFHARHPNSLFYLHTLIGAEHNGIEIPTVAESLGISDAVRWTDQYGYAMGVSERYMADLYRSFDVLTCASLAEGFGIPILEAQACGTPVVTNASTSMPELTWAGVTVTKNQAVWSPLGAWTFMPDVDAILEAYEHLYDLLGVESSAAKLREAAVAGAEEFRWDRIVEDYWKPLLGQPFPGGAGG